MNPKNPHIDKPRFRNAGDDFHFLWAGRRAMRLLDKNSGLVAVVMEGISSREQNTGDTTTAGVLGIDLAEYYGSEIFIESDNVLYYQLKYSTTDSDTQWSAGDLKEFWSYSGERFNSLVKEHSQESIIKKVRFYFVTNRPISPNLNEALAILKSGNSYESFPSHVRNACHAITKNSAVTKSALAIFCKLLILQGEEPNRLEQEQSLGSELDRYLPTTTVDFITRMADTIRKMALPENKNVPFRKLGLLNTLGVASEDRLFPAPSWFESIEHLQLSRQDQKISEAILNLNGKAPIIIHASGGVGKSVLATRLQSLLPRGSKAVIFDGFAGGRYRQPDAPRYKPKEGLVQIINELAQQGLCDPLLPLDSASSEVYFKNFKERLLQAASHVATQQKGALLLVVVDAADNLELAASEQQEQSFVRGLLQQEFPPEGRLVVLCRSERLDLLKPPLLAIRIRLEGFDQQQSGAFLRQKYPNATNDQVMAFYRLTSGIPRIQSYLMGGTNSLGDLLRPGQIKFDTGDQAVQHNIEQHLNKIRDTAHAQAKEVDSLCIALAVLPPMVPVKILAQAGKVSADLVRSLVGDMGHFMVLEENGVRFRDEPAETWFQKHFGNQKENFSLLVDRLRSMADEDLYVAEALPRLLFEAGQRDDLFRLALMDNVPDARDAVRKREILLKRVQYALRVAVGEETGLRLPDCCYGQQK